MSKAGITATENAAIGLMMKHLEEEEKLSEDLNNKSSRISIWHRIDA